MIQNACTIFKLSRSPFIFHYMPFQASSLDYFRMNSLLGFSAMYKTSDIFKW